MKRTKTDGFREEDYYVAALPALMLMAIIAVTAFALRAQDNTQEAQEQTPRQEQSSPATLQREQDAQDQEVPQQDAAAQSKPDSERVEVELILLRPYGFEPAEITRPKGRFILAVDNRSAETEVVLELSKENKEKVHEVRARKRRHSWDGFADLKPGTYVLSDPNQPERVCRITITAK